MDEPIPAVTAEQMREVDRAMVEDYGIALIQMMENAGRALARLAAERYDPRHVVVLAGSGGNGGGGLVAARHLHNWGRRVEVVLAKEAAAFSGVPALQLSILDKMGVTQDPESISAAAGLIIDALIGYSLTGDPTGRTAELIDAANTHPAPVLSLDAPSGLDASTGRIGRPCVRADSTMTLALPKTGLSGSPVVGDLYLADIAVPPELYRRMGLDVGVPFQDGSTVRLSGENRDRSPQ